MESAEIIRKCHLLNKYDAVCNYISWMMWPREPFSECHYVCWSIINLCTHCIINRCALHIVFVFLFRWYIQTNFVYFFTKFHKTTKFKITYVHSLERVEHLTYLQFQCLANIFIVCHWIRFNVYTSTRRLNWEHSMFKRLLLIRVYSLIYKT